jgi:hypothetical protein
MGVMEKWPAAQESLLLLPPLHDRHTHKHKTKESKVRKAQG